jgi:hypothetical protein
MSPNPPVHADSPPRGVPIPLAVPPNGSAYEFSSHSHSQVVQPSAVIVTDHSASALVAAAETHSPAPDAAGAMADVAQQPHSGPGTPKAKFIETLQGKSAWDALIHGSFS